MIHQYSWTPYHRQMMLAALMTTRPISPGEWHGMDVRGSKAHMTHELEDVTILVPSIPGTVAMIQQKIEPDLPWAEEHFLERVSGVPHNPPPSAVRWPYAVRGNIDHLVLPDDPGDSMGNIPRFDHTYPERFWPDHAGHDAGNCEQSPSIPCLYGERRGIRFPYGNLQALVELLVRKPLTRQAFLPVWFPEDTGACFGQRVPCTLGYHFMIRDGRLSCRYYMRSCDVVRHLTNDVYLACRLTQWITEQVNARTNKEFGVDDPGGFMPGRLVMHISSLHAFLGDVPKLKARINARP